MSRINTALVVALALVATSAGARMRAQDTKPAAAPAPSATAKAREKNKTDELAEEAARKAREERESRVPTVVQEKERPKVEVQAKPELKYEAFRRQVELKMAAKRAELIGYLDQILAQKPAETERPELLFQKAELFLEESQYHFFEGMQLDAPIFEAQEAGNKGKAQELSGQKDRELASSKKWSKDAIALFAEIEKKYPKFDRMPDVLYAMGQAYWDSVQYKDALRVYRRLIKDFPKSKYVSDAWLAFGEYYFQVGPEKDKDVRKALESYIEAAKVQDSPVFGYATYKQGWCYYNITRHDKAAEKFKEVILYSNINADLLGNRKIGLAREARKDFVLAYAQYGAANAAPKEFAAIAEPPEVRTMLERLADIYYGDGKDREAITVYQTLMKMEPDNTRNPLFQGKIVKLASRIGEKRQVVGQARKLVDEYKRVRAVFQNLKAEDKRKETIGEDLRQADEVSDNTLRYLATTWHNEAKKTRDDSTFEYAYELYGDYLDLFPERKEAYEVRFFYAELLYRLEKFEQAGEQYLKVVLADPKGKWAEPSAEEAVRAYEEVVKDYDRAHRGDAPAEAGLKERPIPEQKQKYVSACNTYVTTYPKGKIVVEARYKIARTFYDYNHFKESTPRFLELIEKNGGEPRAEQAANLILDTFNIQEDWAKLNEAARGFLANKGLTKTPEFKDVLLKVLEESSFKLISDYEKKKQYDEAAKRYLAFQAEFPKSTLADRALANGAAMLTRAGQLEKAIRVRVQLVNDYKDSPLVGDQIFAIATAYEQVVAYKDAAAWLERFVEKYPKDTKARDALFNASIYRQGVGDPKSAVADREQYLKLFPDAPDGEEVAYSIATCWEESGNTKNAIAAYLDFANKWRKKNPARAVNAQYKALRILEKSKGKPKDVANAQKDMAAAVTAYKRAGKKVEDIADPAAYVAFKSADVVLDDYRKRSIAKPDNPNQFKKTLAEKRDAKDNVYKAYTEVVKLKSAEWAVASLFRIGEATADLVKSINAVPPPRGLTDEQNQLFRDKLAEQTLPIEEQAAQAMVLCLDESARFAVFNEWTRRCLSYLEENRATTYPKSQLEARQPLTLRGGLRDKSNGLVLELPKAGERAKAEPGTEPVVPVTPVVAQSGDKKGEGFDFDEGTAQ